MAFGNMEIRRLCRTLMCRATRLFYRITDLLRQRGSNPLLLPLLQPPRGSSEEPLQASGLQSLARAKALWPP